MRRILTICLPALALLAQCTVNPATGDRQFTAFMSPEQERQVGQEEHPKILAQFGGAYDAGPLGGYVATIGGRLAAHAEMPADQFTFTILNDPLVNAFALPGGYVYVTRGLISLANSEAELAGVIGHEIGHVTARHTAERYSRAQATGIGAAVLGVLLGSSQAAQLAQQGAQLYLLSFSREQEYEADKLGVRYLTRAGYDPFAEADFLDTLNRHSTLEAQIAGREPSKGDFLSTHPNTAKRVVEAIEEAEGVGMRPHDRPRRREAFLRMLDGMLYGEDPAQGLVRGNVFWHPDLGFTFTAPRDFQMANTPQAVVIQGGQNLGAVFDGAKVASNVSMTGYVRDQWGSKLRLGSLQSFTVDGMPAAGAMSRVTSQGQSVDLRLVAIRFSSDRVYRFQIVTPPNPSSNVSDAFERMVMSFRKITDSEKGKYKPRRIQVVNVGPGDTVAGFARRFPYDDGHNVERFLVLNGLDSASELRAGQQVKLIVEE